MTRPFWPVGAVLVHRLGDEARVCAVEGDDVLVLFINDGTLRLHRLGVAWMVWAGWTAVDQGEVVK